MTRVMMHDYASADAYLGRKVERPIANNTRLIRRGESIAVRLHSTDVVTYHPDGTYTLDSGGWLTVTTKDRLNTYTPVRVNVWSDRGRWYVNRYTADTGEWFRFPDHPEWDYRAGSHERTGWFFDGIRMTADGTILNPVSDATAKHLPRATRNRQWYPTEPYYGMRI